MAAKISNDLSYPIDYREAYQSRIRFTVRKAEPLTESTNNVLRNINDTNYNGQTPDQLAKQAQLNDQQKRDGTESLVELSAKYSNDVNAPIVKLFVPVAITLQDGVNYNNVDLGILGGNIAGAMASGQSLAASTIAGLENAGTSFIDVLKSGLDMSKPAGQVAAARFTRGTTGNIVKLVGQVTTNPNTRVLFNNVNLRQFNFQFKMIPTSAREAEEIEKIVKHFRTELYPELIAQNTGYKFPNAFGISVHHKNKHAKIQRFPDCFLTAVDTVYNTTSGVFHKDGYPSEVDMTLRFQEMRALSKRDITEREL